MFRPIATGGSPVIQPLPLVLSLILEAQK